MICTEPRTYKRATTTGCNQVTTILSLAYSSLVPQQASTPALSLSADDCRFPPPFPSPSPPKSKQTKARYYCTDYIFVQEGAGLEAEVLASFLALVPETSQFHEILNKIFRKKIKRAKVSYGHTTSRMAGVVQQPTKANMISCEEAQVSEFFCHTYCCTVLRTECVPKLRRKTEKED